MYFPLNFCENFKNSFAAKYLRATDSKLIPFLKIKNKKKNKWGVPLPSRCVCFDTAGTTFC